MALKSPLEFCEKAGEDLGGRGCDGETVVIREFRGILGLSEEGAYFEVFSREKAGCPFRRSETRLFAEFAPFHHPSFALPTSPAD
jgi:hypothetical protein